MLYDMIIYKIKNFEILLKNLTIRCSKGFRIKWSTLKISLAVGNRFFDSDNKFCYINKSGTQL